MRKRQWVFLIGALISDSLLAQDPAYQEDAQRLAHLEHIATELGKAIDNYQHHRNPCGAENKALADKAKVLEADNAQLSEKVRELEEANNSLREKIAELEESNARKTAEDLELPLLEDAFLDSPKAHSNDVRKLYDLQKHMQEKAHRYIQEGLSTEQQTLKFHEDSLHHQKGTIEKRHALWVALKKQDIESLEALIQEAAEGNPEALAIGYEVFHNPQIREKLKGFVGNFSEITRHNLEMLMEFWASYNQEEDQDSQAEEQADFQETD